MIEHAALAVPQQPCGVVAEEVEIGVSIYVGECCTTARRKGEWKRCVSEHRPRLPAGHVFACFVVVAAAARVAIGKIAAGFYNVVTRHVSAERRVTSFVVVATNRLCRPCLH